MTTALEARTLSIEPAPHLVALTKPPEKSGIIIVGSTTLTRKALVPPTVSFPSLADIDPVNRRYLSAEAISEIQDRFRKRNIQIQDPVYGHAVDIGLRLGTLLNSSSMQDKFTPIKIVSFADTENKKRLEEELDLSTVGVNHVIYQADNSMPHALAYATDFDFGTERIIYSTSPDIELTHVTQDFNIGNRRLPEHVIIGSLPELQERTFLRKLTDRLIKTNTPYTVIPGMVRNSDDQEAIITAIEHASSLMVTEDELQALIAGRGKRPEDEYKQLMLQGLSALSPSSLFMILNEGGALGVTKRDFDVAQVAATSHDSHISTDDYRDAFVVGAFMGNDLVYRLQRGSMSASFTMQTNGVPVHLPSEFEMMSIALPSVTTLL